MKIQFYINKTNLSVSQNQNYLSLATFRHPQIQIPMCSEFYHKEKLILLSKLQVCNHFQGIQIVKKYNKILAVN